MKRRWVAMMLSVGVVIALATVASAADLVAGKALYAKWCQGCHGADGGGNPAMEKMLKTKLQAFGGMDLSKLPASERDAREAELRKIIAEGKRPMTGFAKKLSVEEQENVLKYIETTFMKGGQ